MASAFDATSQQLPSLRPRPSALEVPPPLSPPSPVIRQWRCTQRLDEAQMVPISCSPTPRYSSPAGGPRAHEAGAWEIFLSRPAARAGHPSAAESFLSLPARPRHGSGQLQPGPVLPGMNLPDPPPLRRAHSDRERLPSTTTTTTTLTNHRRASAEVRPRFQSPLLSHPPLSKTKSDKDLPSPIAVPLYHGLPPPSPGFPPRPARSFSNTPSPCRPSSSRSCNSIPISYLSLSPTFPSPTQSPFSSSPTPSSSPSALLSNPRSSSVYRSKEQLTPKRLGPTPSKGLLTPSHAPRQSRDRSASQSHATCQFSTGATSQPSRAGGAFKGQQLPMSCSIKPRGASFDGMADDDDECVFKLPVDLKHQHQQLLSSWHAISLRKSERHSPKQPGAPAVTQNDPQHPAQSSAAVFSLQELELATNGWAAASALGKGGYGTVYKGTVSGKTVAIKTLHEGAKQGIKEYSTEVFVLSNTRHKNIVRLLGHCPEAKCLVYEFVANGSLHDWLKDPARRAKLDWSRRVRIMSEVASALATLHEASPQIVHRDLKPGNILLDEDMSAKLADVGIARLVEDEGQWTYTVAGTAGYIDPEAMKTFEVSAAADVYAFGLNMLQLVTGESSIFPVHHILADLPMSGNGTQYILPGAVQRFMDRADKGGHWPVQLLSKVCHLALRCVARESSTRPSMASEIAPTLQEMISN